MFVFYFLTGNTVTLRGELSSSLSKLYTFIMWFDLQCAAINCLGTALSATPASNDVATFLSTKLPTGWSLQRITPSVVVVNV